MYDSDVKHDNAQLQKKLQRLYTLNRNKKIDLTFRPPFLKLLESLGNPHENLPPVIHVAGTNGKGSTIAMLKSILETAAYKVHTYTSPHLVRFNERIVLSGQQIDDTALEALIDEALNLNGGEELTFFEITTAIAFAAFARTPADICLLEVGMGGRLDCTNVIKNPLLSIITPIGFDHAEFLGDTLEKIAAEKAGIIKENTPCLIAAQKTAAIEALFKDKAAELNAPFYKITAPLEGYDIGLSGAHQRHNAATAIKALEIIKDRIPVRNDHIQNGLKAARWPARMQKLKAADYGLDDKFELYLDGGHNEDAGHIIAGQIKAWKEKDNKPVYIVLGMMQKKDLKAFTSAFSEYADDIILTAIKDEPLGQDPANMAKIIPRARTAPDFMTALRKIGAEKPAGRILICGSLYLAGQVLSQALKDPIK